MNAFSRGFGRFANSLLNLRYFVVISSLLFFLIIGFAFFLVYQNAGVMRDQIKDDFNQQQLILARQSASQVEAILRDLEMELKSLQRFQEDGPDKMSIAEEMKALVGRTWLKGLIEVGLLDQEGELVESHHIRSVLPIEAPRVIPDCRWDEKNRLILGPLRVDETDPEHSSVTSIVCTKITADIPEADLLFARIDVSRLLETVTRNIRSGKTGYAWVIDEHGMFLSHPEKEFIGKNAFMARKERKPYISFTQINRIMKDRMLQGEEGTSEYVSGWHRGIEREIDKLIAFSPVRSRFLSPTNVWSVAVVAPKIEVAEAVNRVYSRHFAAEAAIIAGLFLFGFLMAIYQQRISQTLKEKVQQTKADLEEIERIYQRIVEQSTDMIYILDLEMRIILLNRQAMEMFSSLVITIPEGGIIEADADLQRKELYIGKKVDELFRPEDASFLLSQVDRFLELKSGHSYWHTINVYGHEARLSTKLIPIRDDHGEIQYVLGISRDITEKMEMDQRIYNAEKLASIGTLASGVAHEINNPLAIILGFTDLLLENFDESSPEYEDLKAIDFQANHAKKVVEDLLGFARVTEGMEDTVDIKHGIETVVTIVTNTLMTKKIELVIELPDGLPRVRGDSREFQQVIFNLINNAVAAMKKKGGTLTLKAWAQGPWLYVSVADTGSGIPKKIQARIFEPFVTTKKVGEGTGLGLSLCYGIMKKYGGNITFTSISEEDWMESKSGTTFTVSLPIQKDEDQA